jgi:hypothetical protein
MTLQTITKSQLADDLGLIDSDGRVSECVVANLLRAPMARWGLSPKRTVLKYARDQLRAGGLEDVGCVQKVLQRLMSLGECKEVRVGQEVYIAPAEPRWMNVGNGIGTYLGVTAPPKGIYCARSVSNRDIVQRIFVNSDEDVALLQMAGVRESYISEWLTPLDYLRHASRRMRRPVKSDVFRLIDFWDILESALFEDGLPLSAEAEVRAVTGEPGQFFGRYNAETLEGRWSSSLPDGVWCAYRRGYSDAHWHPTVISVDGKDLRAFDLYDQDEWRWALLARGLKYHLEEVVHVESDHVKVAFPLPSQLFAAMEILGEQAAPWVWGLNSGAPDVWGGLK